MFGIYAGTGETDVGELIPLVCEEFLKACEGVGEDEVSRARAQLRAGILMSLESTTARCERLARDLAIFGRPLPIAEIVGRIEAVSSAAVAAAARRLGAGPPTMAALGPLARVEGYQTVAQRLG